MQLAEITPVLTTTRQVSYSNYIIQTSVLVQRQSRVTSATLHSHWIL